jgi:hypothetical protein
MMMILPSERAARVSYDGEGPVQAEECGRGLKPKGHCPLIR